MTDSPGLRPEQLFESLDDERAAALLPTGALALIDLLRSDLLVGSERPATLGRVFSIELAVDDSVRRQHLLDAIPPSKVAELEARTQTRLVDLKGKDLTKKQHRDLKGFLGRAATAASATEVMPSAMTIQARRSLFPHQKQAAADVESHLYRGSGRTMLHLPTGVGKTRTAMSIVASHLRTRQEGLVLWLAATQELLEQAVEEFEATWEAVGDRAVTCLRFWSNHNPSLSDITDGIVVAGLAKLHSHGRTRENLWSLGDRTSLVVFDEAHQAVAETYKDIVNTVVSRQPRTPKTGLLGLSATPGRTWSDIDADAAVAALFHDNKVTLDFGDENPIAYLTRQGYLAEVQFSRLVVDAKLPLAEADLAAAASSPELPDHIIDALAVAEQRNASIFKVLLDLAERHQSILVFAASVRHAELLASVCRGVSLKAEVLTGNTDKADRQQAIGRFKRGRTQILTNYGVLTAGFDAPAASAALIARPTKSLVLYSQMVGRVIRGPKAGGKPRCEVVTVVDTSLPGFRDVAEAFTNWEDVWTD